jgi:hypothetical protein
MTKKPGARGGFVSDGEDAPSVPPVSLYLGDVLQSFSNGVQLDLRVRLAVDWLKGGLLVPPREGKVFELTKEHAQEIVRFALDLSTELIEQGMLRGLIRDLPDTDELNAAYRKHLRRAARASVLPQIAAQEIAREEGPGIVPGMLVPSGSPGRGLV